MRLLLLIIFISWTGHLNGQRTANNFRHITPDEGLSHEAVKGIAQDKYGFIWLGTFFGLNRFDGINIKKWYHDPKDSTSLSNNFVRSMCHDSRGRIWIGGDPGFCTYDYRTDKFIRYSNSNYNMFDICEDTKGRLWVGTHNGIKLVDTINRKLLDVTYPDSILNRYFSMVVRDVHAGKNGIIYFATPSGVIQFDAGACVARLINDSTFKGLPSNNVTAVSIDGQDNLWMSLNYNNAILARISEKTGKVDLFDDFRYKNGEFVPNTIYRLYSDNRGRLWVASGYFGLSRYDENKGFLHYKNDPLLPNSISSNHAISVMHDRNGILWVGTEGYGVNFFNPDQDIFTTLQKNEYINNGLPDNWSRTFTSDDKGNLYVGLGKGLAVLNKQLTVSRVFNSVDSNNKQLHSLSVRSLLKDREGKIWIGTAEGLNRYHPGTGKMDFYGKNDSIATGFTWAVRELKNGKIMVANTAGLYEYVPSTNKFFHYKNHPVLKDYHYGLRCFTEDSKGRWWIGTFNYGIVVYDPSTNKVLKHLKRDTVPGGLSSNFPHDIVEDREGNMWISTRYKLNCYNLEKNSNRIYSEEDGFPINWIGGILIDKKNRLWIATGKGLCVMDENRKVVKVFNKTDGLLSSQFNDQPGYVTPEGQFIFPGLKGVVMFDPMQYQWSDAPVPAFISSFRVLNEELHGKINLEELTDVKLSHKENYFSIEMVGLDYQHPEQLWYAYKLDGFDKDWTYSKERIVGYTNVPGGSYVFRYKVSTRPDNWDVEEKSIEIFIGTVFYRTWWFRTAVILLLMAAVISLYRYRIRQKEKMLKLEGKAQLLEKEKALVMYENLKQQLNPHFLFNSLTSLSSLIRVDQKTAGDFLESLSKTYRYILKNRDSEIVSLEDEIRFANTYVKLQTTRFEKGFLVNFNVAEEHMQRKIAPVTIQNLLENAIKHNIIDEESPLVVEIFSENDYIIVRNNLQKKNFVETSNRQGLVNLTSLYNYLTEKPVIITDDGRHFTVKIPLL